MRIRFMSFIVALICLLSACTEGVVSTEQTTTVPKRDVVIAAVGDSLTVGVGDERRKGYVGLIADQLERQSDIRSVTIKNYAVEGYRTEHLLNKLQDQETQEGLKKADYILFTIGGNDLMKVVRENIADLTIKPFRHEQKLFAERFANILFEIRKQNSDAEVIYISLYNPFKFTLSELKEVDQVVEEWNQAAEIKLNKVVNMRMVDIADIFEERTNEKRISKDEFHPNQIGYKLIAERVFAQMINPAE
ncbi:SGNH/GDSL hydrolase family protein [Bacillus sp. CLL-7-23]|uniref:SGNH/GDSL hydrolase family protein n=1 Tax=Bacillus changyiensis TaxID=3004103 RepID=A0ABT4X2S4_9BACI|nr:SGNH/GDSL hydrolase family protein [Bacillus changyiensis]MDA7025702.1 SGNH/GDSL hydrolase family protein [Bacillus changyiensis]